MNTYLIVLIAVILFIVLIVVVWLAYSVTAAFQQTLTLTVPFDETYRYAPNLNKQHKFKLDSIKVTVTGSIKKDAGFTISPGALIRQLVQENIIDSYKNCLLVHEANTFIVDEQVLEEQVLKRCPITKNPSLENLSIIFFNKLASLMPKIGCQLVSVKLASENLNVTHSRYKMSDYGMKN